MNEQPKVTIFVTGTANPQRIEWLLKSIWETDVQQFPFFRKIVTIDEFDGHELNWATKTWLQAQGWEVYVDQFRSRVKTFDKVFNQLITDETDIVFYNEDDIIPILPSIETLTQVFNTEIDGKQCGILSLNYGGSEGNQFPGKERKPGDIVYANENLILETENWKIFKRLEEMANPWYFEFPAMFVPRQLFTDVFNATYGKKGGQIEMAMTQSFFQLKMNDKYYKASRLRKNCVELLQEDMTRFPEVLSLIMLDVRQGHGVHIGNSDFN